MATRRPHWTPPRSTRKAEWAQAPRGLIALLKRLGFYYHPIISQLVGAGSSHRTMGVDCPPSTSGHIARSWISPQRQHRLSSKPLEEVWRETLETNQPKECLIWLMIKLWLLNTRCGSVIQSLLNKKCSHQNLWRCKMILKMSLWRMTKSEPHLAPSLRLASAYLMIRSPWRRGY